MLSLRSYIVTTSIFCLILLGQNVFSCAIDQKVSIDNPEIVIDESALTAMAKARLTKDDLFKTLKIISMYETGGCWGGATGNSDNQLVSVGVMQWNFGQGTLQPLLKRFSEKFSSPAHFELVRDELMPKYGKQLFDLSCRVIPVKKSCSDFLLSHMNGSIMRLDLDIKEELDNLFSYPVMRQLQVDYFARAVTSVLSDLDRVYITPEPAPWQVAWAVDVKTQQGDRFPTDKNIKKIREQSDTLSVEERTKRINGILKWYDGLCDSGTSEGIKHDCDYNIRVWPTLFNKVVSEKARERTIQFSHLIARTAKGVDGAYQANSFQRRATIVFGRGSVHQSIFDMTAP